MVSACIYRKVLLLLKSGSQFIFHVSVSAYMFIFPESFRSRMQNAEFNDQLYCLHITSIQLSVATIVIPSGVATPGPIRAQVLVNF